jgi:hypothetical protein
VSSPSSAQPQTPHSQGEVPAEQEQQPFVLPNVPLSTHSASSLLQQAGATVLLDQDQEDQEEEFDRIMSADEDSKERDLVAEPEQAPDQMPPVQTLTTGTSVVPDQPQQQQPSLATAKLGELKNGQSAESNRVLATSGEREEPLILTTPPPALKDASAAVQPPPQEPPSNSSFTTGLLRKLSRSSSRGSLANATPHSVSFPLDPHAYRKPKKTNYIRTTKYTLLTFIPLNLYFQVGFTFFSCMHY